SPRTKINKDGVNYDSAQTTKLYSPDVTKLDDEIVSIETELGFNPKGAYDSVAAYLAALAGAVAGIVTDFLGLTDTPDSYAGSAGKVVAVKGDATGLEFITAAGGEKCTGAEIDTGTDDAKFATSKAIRDSGLLNGVIAGELAAMTAFTALVDADVFLLEASADSNKKYKTLWSNIKSVLKTYFDTVYTAKAVYDAIVAASGGDYTTLGAAISAGALSIFVKDGTYAESAITVPANARIVGESRLGTIINMQTNNLAAAGAGARFEHCTIIGSGNTHHLITLTATTYFEDVYIDWNGGSNDYNAIECDTAGVDLVMIDCALDVPNVECYGIRFGVNTSKSVRINNFKITGGGSNSMGMIFSGIGGGNAVINNLSIHGTWRSAASFSFSACVVTGMDIHTATQIVVESNARIIGAMDLSIGTTIYLTGSQTCLIGSNVFNATVGGRHCQITGNFIVGTLTLNYITCQVTGNTINNLTLSSGTGFHKIIGNYIYGTFTDSGAKAVTLKNNDGLANINEKDFVYVKNTSGGQLDRGHLVVLKAVAGGNEITTTTTGGDDKVYGVIEVNISRNEYIADNGYGYVQILGKTVYLKVDGTTDIAIGDFISTFTTAGIGKKAAAGDTAIAIALEAYTTDNSSGVIDALLISPRKVGAVV
ncbi:MAG: hypothetical protein WC349_05255, partial [Patescibacteria group bacterium]